MSKKTNKTMSKKNENAVTESEQNQGTLTPDQPDIFNDKNFSAPVSGDEKISDDDFETQSEPLQFYDFAPGTILTGTFCGTGKEIGTGKDSVKTWLIKEHSTKKMFLIPQWDGIKKLGELDGDQLGKKTVRIVYEGATMDTVNPSKVKFHLVKLQFYSKETPANLCVSVSEITNVLRMNEKTAG